MNWYNTPIDLAEVDVDWLPYAIGTNVYEPELVQAFWSKIVHVYANKVVDGWHKCGLLLNNGLVLYYEMKGAQRYIQVLKSVDGLIGDYRFDENEFITSTTTSHVSK